MKQNIPISRRAAAGARLAEGAAQGRGGRCLELHVLGQAGAARPGVLAGRAQRLEDLAQLVQVGVSGEPRPPQQQLCDTATSWSPQAPYCSLVAMSGLVFR